MTETPLPPSAPAPGQGAAIVATPGHFAAWAEKHLEPFLADFRAEAHDARIKSEKALVAVQKAAPVLEKVAALLAQSVKAGTLPAEIIADAETVAAEAASVAGDLAVFGL